MGRKRYAPGVSKAVVEAIINTLVTHPDMTANSVEKHLTRILSKQIIPCSRTIHNHIVANADEIERRRNQYGQGEGPLVKIRYLDAPFKLSSLSMTELQGMNSAVVPILFREQSRRALEKEAPITILHTLWASRLYSTIADLLSANTKAVPESLIWWAGEYAIAEKISLYTQTEFDTSDLDADLLANPDKSLDAVLKQERKVETFNGRPVLNLSDSNEANQAQRRLNELLVGDDILEKAFMTPNIDFAKRDKKRKQIEKEREVK